MDVKVSIIVPVYKTKDTLSKCVDSLLKQTLEEIEIILVDDGSPDESGKMCDSYLEDERVKVIHKENGGLSSARNAGIRVATGEYIGFVDSDDYVCLDMYQRLYEIMLEDKSDICICSHYTVDNQGRIQEHYFQNVPEKLRRKDIINYLILPLIGAEVKTNAKAIEGFVWRNLYKRELLNNYEFKSEREYFAEDIVADLELYTRCEQISIINRCLYYYRYNGESLSYSYRPNVCVLLNNLLQWEEVYLRKEQLLEVGIKRIYATGVKFFLFSIQNVKKGRLKEEDELEALNQIFEQEMLVKSIRKCCFSGYNLKMKVFIILCRMRMIRMLNIIFS